MQGRGVVQPLTTSSAPLRVLIVEDDESNSEVLKLVLEMGGHTAIVAATAQEALDQAAAGRPDVVLLDLGLPDMDGREVSASLRVTTSPAPRIIITSGTRVDAAEAARLGADAVLEKPFDPDRLLAMLEKDKSPS